MLGIYYNGVLKYISGIVSAISHIDIFDVQNSCVDESSASSQQ